MLGWGQSCESYRPNTTIKAEGNKGSWGGRGQGVRVRDEERGWERALTGCGEDMPVENGPLKDSHVLVPGTCECNLI